MSSFRVLQNASAVNSQAMQRNREKLRELSQAISKVGTPTKEMAEAFKQAARQGHELKAKHQQQQQALQKLRSRLKEAGINTRDLGGAERDLKQRIASTNTSLDSQTRRLKQLTAQHSKLAAAKEQLAKTQGLAGSMAASGAAGLATGYAAAQPVMAVLGAYAPNEDSATQLKVSMMGNSGEVSEDFQKITDLATQLGDRLPGTTADFQNMMTMLRRQGLSAQSILGGTGEAAAYLGVQLQMSVEDAAEFAAKMQDATRTAEADMMPLMDIIQRGFYAGVDSGNMLQGFSKIAPVMDIIKKSGIEAANELAPLLIMMDQAGMEGGAAGNAYRKIFQAGLNKKALDDINKDVALKSRGITLSFTGADGNFSGLENLYAQVEKLKVLNDEDRVAIIKDIFGDDSETMTVLNTMMNKGIEGYREVQEKLKNQADLRTRVNEQLSTLSNVMEAAEGSFTNARAEFGAAVAPQLKDILNALGDLAAGIGQWARENPVLAGQMVKTVAGFAALMAVMGALTLTLASILGPFAMVRYGMTLLGIKSLGLVPVFKTVGGALLALGKLAMANPLFLAIALMATAAYLIYKNWNGIGSFFADCWADIQQAFDGGLLGVLRLLVNWSPLGLFYKAFAAVLSYFDIELPASLFDAAEGLTSAILSGLGTSWGEVGAFFGNGWAEIKAACDGALLGVSALILNWSPLGAFYQVFSAVMDYFGVDLPAKFTDFGGMLIDGFVNGINNAMGSARAAVANLGDSTIGWFKEKLGIHSPSRVFAELGGFTMQGLTQGLADGEGDALKQVSSTAKLLTERGAGAISFASDAAGQPLSFDNRPPLTMRPAATAAAGNSTINITINAAQGSDPNAIASAVAQELDRRERQRGVRQRSALYDTE